MREMFRGTQLSDAFLLVSKTLKNEVAELRFLSYRIPDSLLGTENFVAFS